MKKFLITISVFLILFSLGSGISEARKKCLIMGLIPAEDPKSMIQQYTPMKNWMEKKIGRCIKLFTATDYTGVVEAMRAKKVDFAWFGPFSYVLANERAGAEAFAVGKDKEGVTTYHSYLVATPEAARKLRISSPLKGAAGMEAIAERLDKLGKEFTFAFTDPASTSGYAIPRYYMMKAGMVPEEVFKKIGYVGTHDAAELVVRNKIIDIVADNDKSYPKMIKKGKISETSNIIIWKSPPIPGSPLAYRKDLPSAVKKALRDSITGIPQDRVTGYGSITGYELVTDNDYRVVKEVKKAIDNLR
ncbi:MAG TPA: phosphonate ABC transporter substrate-binding protein [Nitrospirae bacterium]|nr:phosphonate ABC transporter substrate-binding protein [Nitrospirota bacterium]